jgi:hypothetical protein
MANKRATTVAEVVQYVETVTAEIEKWRATGKPDIAGWLKIQQKGETILKDIKG